ncbi:unnamed protein product, partial [Owenia fusiformis]
QITDMDTTRVLLIIGIVIQCLTLALSAPVGGDAVMDLPPGGDMFLKKALLSAYEKELENLEALEMDLKKNIASILNKKEELRMRKRQPIQCLISAVSCYGKKK